MTQLAALIDALPRKLQRIVEEGLRPGERPHVLLKGAFKEALICTDERVLIVKNGFMANAFLAANSFQLPYEAISSVDVRFGVLTGLLELSAGGVRTKPKNYWAPLKADTPQASPNCVSIMGRASADRFRAAAHFIMERTRAAKAAGGPGTPGSKDDLLDGLERLAKLRDAGTLTEVEFNVQKARILQG